MSKTIADMYGRSTFVQEKCGHIRKCLINWCPFNEKAIMIDKPTVSGESPLVKGRVLVACEYSGAVRDAFSKLGWESQSCDLLPSEKPGNHHQGDVRELLCQQWDIIIAFPPCTYLCSSGMHWTTRGLRDPKLTEDALEFVRLLMNANCNRIAVENPVGAISTRIRKPDQIIQPHWFGDDASKTTCLWLKNLPALVPTNVLQKPAGRQAGKPDPKRTKQTGAIEGQVETKVGNLPRNRGRNGKPVVRIRLVCASAVERNGVLYGIKRNNKPNQRP